MLVERRILQCTLVSIVEENFVLPFTPNLNIMLACVPLNLGLSFSHVIIINPYYVLI